MFNQQLYHRIYFEVFHPHLLAIHDRRCCNAPARSCGVCGGSGCEARFPGSEDACCAANIMAANNACGTAPCVITASMEQLRTQQQPEAAALADEERPIVEVDTKLEVERQLANKRKCPNGKKVCKDRGTMNSKITCNAKNQCVCPSGYTWVTEGSPASSGYGMCAREFKLNSITHKSNLVTTVRLPALQKLRKEVFLCAA
eukprot:TRINITY_DN747_c0_g1_i9.p1 TRINITY_DN747_c0_g1~~TRINITY_DN747_c0_g1_i9.p1  ORF type:complete len:201 (-),score=20.38 TRINITY_DN747_c0_g1_i9:20-622(-)